MSPFVQSIALVSLGAATLFVLSPRRDQQMHVLITGLGGLLFAFGLTGSLVTMS